MRKVHLACVSCHDELRVASHPGEKHFKLSEVCVLRLVKYYTGPVKGAASHIGERGDLDDAVGHEFLEPSRRDHIPEGVIKRLQVRVELVFQVSWQEAEALSRLHCRACQYDAPYLPVLQCPYSKRNGDIGLSCASRPHGEDKVVFEVCGYHFLLCTVPGPDRFSVYSVDDGRVSRKPVLFIRGLSVEYVFDIIRGKVHLVLSSFFKQKGLSEQEATQAINTYLADKEKQKPDMGKIQSDLQSALSARAAAEVNQAATLEAVKQGVDVNSVPYILKLADFTDVINSDGKVDGDKLTQAVKKVLDDVPAFKTPAKAENSGVKKIGGDGTQTPPDNVTKDNVPSKKWNKFNI